MKTKFETNVASELPKTRMSREPGLPWKVTDEDLEKVASSEDARKSAVTGVPPLKTRAVFIVLLVVTVFVAALYYISVSLIENENVRNSIQSKEILVSSLKTDLEKRENEKNFLNQNLEHLERQVRDLNAQKEIYTAVIQTLTRKEGEPQIGKYRDKKLGEKAEGLKDI